MSSPDPSQTFLLEAADLLTEIEEITLDLKDGRDQGDHIHRLFRAFHTLKGSGAMFGFDAVAGFTHHVETVLDHVRTGNISLSSELLDLILLARDLNADLLQQSSTDVDVSDSRVDDLIERFRAFTPGNAKADTEESVQPASEDESTENPAKVYSIGFTPSADLMATGTNPLFLLDELRELGEATIKADISRIPPLESLQPDHCYLRWDIRLSTNRGIDAIRDVFIFVDGDSDISITEDAAESQSNVTTKVEQATTVQPAAKANIGENKRKPVPDETIRVSSSRLDRLVELVGEFVMNQSRLNRVSLTLGETEITQPVEELDRLVAEMRDLVLGVRMMPIGTTFGRFRRLVHDLSSELGKSVDLVTEGAETELDKTMLEKLGDPLIHLIRNSLDHGIESTDERLASGKEGRGSIRLRATRAGSNVVIDIDDDGRGLNTEAIRAKAVDKQLISPDAELSDEATYSLIFQPGFSTAKSVSSISGRGVGMDVVKKQIDQLRGTIQIKSDPGKGTQVSLILPLTLAIIDGLLVELGSDQFIIPMGDVLESIEFTPENRRSGNGRNLVVIRGELIPYLRLRDLFSTDRVPPAIEKVVIIRYGNNRVGLVVDRVVGNHQTVIQSLGRFFRQIKIASGSTIMGDGRVALILDTAGLLDLATSQSDNLDHPSSPGFATEKPTVPTNKQR